MTFLLLSRPRHRATKGPKTVPWSSIPHRTVSPLPMQRSIPQAPTKIMTRDWRQFASRESPSKMSPGHWTALCEVWYAPTSWVLVYINLMYSKLIITQFIEAILFCLQLIQGRYLDSKSVRNHVYFDGLVWERYDSVANALESCLSCADPAIYACITCISFLRYFWGFRS